jgi:circadian clock protein KaiC
MIQTERVPTGIVGLDPLLDGGFPKARSILVTGEPGTGKSIFALQFLHAGLNRGESGVLVTADEAPMDVIEQAASLGWDLEPHIHKKELAILNAASYLRSLPNASGDCHIDIERAVGDIAVIANQIGAQRLVLDPAGPFVLPRDSVLHMQDQTRLLIQSLRASTRTTNILTSYAVPRAGERSMHGIEEYLVAGAIVLEIIWKDGALARSLIVEKMRATNVRPKQLEFDIVQGEGIAITTAD